MKPEPRIESKKLSKEHKLVIFGDGEFAEIAYEYFQYDSLFDVVSFTVERSFMKRKDFFSLPIVEFEELEKHYNPAQHGIFVAVPSTQLNRIRTRIYKEAKRKGFTPVSYISTKAFVWRNVQLGENCFVFENNVLQLDVKIGNNVILWSGNHIGHRTTIGDNCFISSHVVISGNVKVGRNCYFGVNSTIRDYLNIADDSVIGAGAVVIKDTEPGKVYVGNPARPMEKSSFQTFNVNSE